ncbi:MAG: aldo/keto reductase [Dehalococcoidales bacterium]|nr:aldo/keto reductase [Dehalococcoidales bacterium]
MDYVRLGNSGLKVSRVCLGTMTFGREADEETSFKIMDRYVELGGNFVDTADAYSVGKTEEVVGRWLGQRGNRQQIVLATKVYNVMGPGPNERGLSRIHIQQGVEDSLRRLQTDVIDLYQIHRWDPYAPLEETAEVLNDLVRQGKVRYIGCSNLAAWQLSRYLQTMEQNHWSRFVSLQPVYNALNRSIESELLPLCRDEGLGVMTYNPLAGGMLTGKYKPGEALPPGSRLEAFKMYYERYFTKEATDIVNAFLAAARERGCTPAQLALAWVLGEPRLTCPIIGARTMEQFNDSMGGLELALTPEEREAVPSVLQGRWVGIDPVYDRKL